MASTRSMYPSKIVMSRYTTVKIKKTISRTKDRRARRTSATNDTAAITAVVTNIPAPSVVPTPTLGEPVAKAAEKVCSRSVAHQWHLSACIQRRRLAATRAPRCTARTGNGGYDIARCIPDGKKRDASNLRAAADGGPGGRVVDRTRATGTPAAGLQTHSFRSAVSHWARVQESQPRAVATCRSSRSSWSRRCAAGRASTRCKAGISEPLQPCCRAWCISRSICS